MTLITLCESFLFRFRYECFDVLFSHCSKYENTIDLQNKHMKLTFEGISENYVLLPIRFPLLFSSSSLELFQRFQNFKNVKRFLNFFCFCCRHTEKRREEEEEGYKKGGDGLRYFKNTRQKTILFSLATTTTTTYFC